MSGVPPFEGNSQGREWIVNAQRNHAKYYDTTTPPYLSYGPIPPRVRVSCAGCGAPALLREECAYCGRHTT